MSSPGSPSLVAVDVLQLAVAVAVFGFDGDGVDLGQAQGFGQPEAVGEKAFGLARHVALLQVVDQLRFLLAAAFAHGFENAGLGDAAEIVVDRRRPAGRDHVEADVAGDDVAMGDRAGAAIPGFAQDVDRGGGQMREQLHLAVGVHGSEVIPQRALRLRQLSLPLGVPGLELQHGGAFLEAGGLAGHAGNGRADLHAVVGAGEIEDAQAHAMQDGAEGDFGASGHSVPQRDGAMGGKLGQEPFRQRLDRIAVVIVLGRDRVEAAVENDRRDTGGAGHG